MGFCIALSLEFGISGLRDLRWDIENETAKNVAGFRDACDSGTLLLSVLRGFEEKTRIPCEAAVWKCNSITNLCIKLG